MTQEDKELLLKDLCARLPYGVKCSFGVDNAVYEITGINPTCCGASNIQATHIKSNINGDFTLSSCKPYLFPLSSMTDKQRKEWQSLMIKDPFVILYYTPESFDYLYKNHIDIRGLISQGLAIDATNLNIY